jgi:NitT/TauT family transport system substrate-binding protein
MIALRRNTAGRAVTDQDTFSKHFPAGMLKIAFLSVLCFLTASMMPSGADSQALSVATWKTAQTIQPFYYEKFLDRGEKVTILPFTNPADMKTALTARNVVMCGTTLPYAITAASRGEPVVLVASLCNKCSALVVGKDSNITTMKDLKDKKIGYVPGTIHEVFLREILARNGLNFARDIRATRVDFFDMGTALANGSIDAFLSGEPFPAIAVLKGYGRLLAYPYFDDGVGTINAGMLVLRETVDKNPELVARLVKAHADATDYLTQHPEEWLRKSAEFGTPLEVLEQAMPNMELAWKMDSTFVERAKALGQRMQELGIIERQPDYGKLFDLRFVEKISPR